MEATHPEHIKTMFLSLYILMEEEEPRFVADWSRWSYNWDGLWTTRKTPGKATDKSIDIYYF